MYGVVAGNSIPIFPLIYPSLKMELSSYADGTILGALSIHCLSCILGISAASIRIRLPLLIGHGQTITLDYIRKLLASSIIIHHL